MLGKTHALSGAAAGAVTCAALGASLPVTAVVVPIMAGAAYLPDLDSPGSTVSRSLGPITGAVSRGIMGLSKGIVHITRGPKDTVKGAHRTFTHSLIGFAASEPLPGPPQSSATSTSAVTTSPPSSSPSSCPWVRWH